MSNLQTQLTNMIPAVYGKVYTLRVKYEYTLLKRRLLPAEIE